MAKKKTAKKTTPEKPPTKAEASVASGAMRTGKATPAQIRSMGGRIVAKKGKKR